MQAPYLAAAVQMDSSTDQEANLEQATELIQQAAREGAQLVVLPELFSYLGDLAQLALKAQSMDGPVLQQMRQLAIEHQLVLCAGTLAIASTSDPHKVHNRSVLFGPHGQVLSTYDKIHCFDIRLPQVSVVESDYVCAGTDVSIAATPVGQVGQAICYDLRFPELFRRLALDGMQICLLPAAFTEQTGEAHWEVLVRARAIENQSYFIAANQCGQYGSNIRCFGNSLIVDPWGNVLARGEACRAGVIYGEVDLARQREIRAQLPALTHRRLV